MIALAWPLPGLRVETFMWLLPVVFMLHEFEEIIMLPPWIVKNQPRLNARFPRLAKRVLPHYARLSPSSFSLAVAEEYLLLSALTLIAVEHSLYAFWAGILLGFLLHLIVHIVQFIIYRGYVPAIITSVIGCLYGVLALHALNAGDLLAWRAVLFWTLLFSVVIALNLLCVHALALRFERWLKAKFS